MLRQTKLVSGVSRVQHHSVLGSLKPCTTQKGQLIFLLLNQLRLCLVELFHFLEEVSDYCSVLFHFFLYLGKLVSKRATSVLLVLSIASFLFHIIKIFFLLASEYVRRLHAHLLKQLLLEELICALCPDLIIYRRHWLLD